MSNNIIRFIRPITISKRAIHAWSLALHWIVGLTAFIVCVHINRTVPMDSFAHTISGLGAWMALLLILAGFFTTNGRILVHKVTTAIRTRFRIID